MMSETNVDWVTERAVCSGDEVFERLSAGVQADVIKRNELRDRIHPDIWFQFRNHGTEFSVTIAGGFYFNSVRAPTVRFTRDGQGIAVTGEMCASRTATTRTVFELHGSACLDAEGRCRIRVGDRLLTEWQFRQQALEGLFFDLKPEIGLLAEPAGSRSYRPAR